MKIEYAMKKIWIFITGVALIAAAASGQELKKNTELVGTFTRSIQSSYNDIWGYAAGGKEYALLGTYNGTSIVDVTTPGAYSEVAFIPGPYSLWRDMKTYGTHLYVTHDANWNGMTPGIQIIDLSELPNKSTLVNTYAKNIPSGLAHNLFIADKYAYISGTRGTQKGIIILDLTDPVNPSEVGGWPTYWHDVWVNNDTIFSGCVFAIKIRRSVIA